MSGLKRLNVQVYHAVISQLVSLLQTQLGEKAFLMFVASVVGLITGAAAVMMRAFVHWLPQIPAWCADHNLGALTVLIPAFGVTIAYGLQLLINGSYIEKSLSPLIYSLSVNRYYRRWRSTFSHIFTAGITVGLGGSAGLEAPIVLTGAAIGSKVGSFLRVIREHRGLLLGCGAAAGIAGIFDSPIAGVLFAAEVLLPTFSVGALIPVLLSAALAVMVSKMVFHSPALFYIMTTNWNSEALGYYVLLAAICGLVGVYMIKVTYSLGGWLKDTFSQGQRLLFGIFGLSVIIFLFPMLYGEGYVMIQDLFNGNPHLVFQKSVLYSLFDNPAYLLLILSAAAIFLKVFAAVLTIQCGGDGGIFAPSLFTGAYLGFVFAKLINLTGFTELQEPNFVAAGMCGVFTAVIRAPMTGIFLVAEITGGHMLLTPLMVVAAISYFTARYFEPHCVYTRVLWEQGLMKSKGRAFEIV